MAKTTTLAPRDTAVATWRRFWAGQDHALLEVWERHSNLPLLALAAAMLPLLLLPQLVELDPAVRRYFGLAGWAIWTVFAVDLAVRLWLAEHRRQFLRSN